MLSPITATIESARFFARSHGAFQTVKSGRRRWGCFSWCGCEMGHFIIASSQGGMKKARDGGASLALLYIYYSAFRASTTASKPVPLLDLIRTWSPSLSSAFKSAIKASLSM